MPDPILSVSALTKVFGELRAVDEVSFDVQPGEIFAFLGPNGAGKSTAIKMLTTVMRPTSGRITVNGFDVQTRPDDVRRSIGIVFQDPTLDAELTAYENMELHAALYQIPRPREDKINELLRFVDLHERKDHMVKTFSGGMKRRLEIARGLLHHPTILFLDEPTLGLDPQTRNLMWQYLRHLNETERMSVFVTTHYMEEAQQVAHRIAIIDRGKIIALGTLDALKQQTGAENLEGAFLALTGRAIREETADAKDQTRQMISLWRGR
jgi:ABC-2 type transport system ATP-binding protein